MNKIPNIRPFLSSEWQIYKDLRLQALADSPNAFSRTLAEEQTRSDEEWAKRIAKGATLEWDIPLLAEVDGVPAGLALRLYVHAGFKTTGKVEPLRPGSEFLCQDMRLELG